MVVDSLLTVFSFSKVTSVSYTHLRAHETDSYLVCRLLLEKKKGLKKVKKIHRNVKKVKKSQKKRVSKMSKKSQRVTISVYYFFE